MPWHTRGLLALLLWTGTLLAAVMPASATPLVFQSEFSTAAIADDPEGLAFHPTSGNLLLTDEDGLVTEVTVAGVPTGTSFSHGQNGGSAEGATVDPVSGNLLITNNDEGLVLAFSLAGTALGLFLDVSDVSDEPDSVAIHPTTGNVWIADGPDQAIYEFDRLGNLVSSFDTSAYAGDPAGLAFLDGERLLISDDGTGCCGTGQLYEVQIGGLGQGTLLQSFDPSPFGINDPEGLDYDPITRRLFVMSDFDEKVAIFGVVPEPGAGLLLATSLAALAARRVRRLS